MEDFTLFLICLGLVGCGLFFFGYPIGRADGRKQMRRELEKEFFLIPRSDYVVVAQIADPQDVLDAEILEVKNV